ncbi:hypothetical protein Tco_0815448, partial [Tanacetum coccineum]
METQKPLVKDEDGEEVDVHIWYISNIQKRTKTMAKQTKPSTGLERVQEIKAE